MERYRAWNRILWQASLIFFVVLVGIRAHVNAGPSAANVLVSQRAGAKLVDVYYDINGGTPPMTVTLMVSSDGGYSYGVSAPSLTGDIGSGVSSGKRKHIVWNAEADWDGNISNRMRFKVTVKDSTQAEGFALIPEGSFQMGDVCGDYVEESSLRSELPVHSVYVSEFYTGKKMVTKEQWDDVRTWALDNGYISFAEGTAKAANHPVKTTWSGAMKWCNARSEMEGLTPCYRSEGEIIRGYITGTVTCDWQANGYRLPTEAEWEKAARGGLAGARFPWGNTISHSQANYKSRWDDGVPVYSYDLAQEESYHPTYKVGSTPYTSPVGSFAPNGYGLYDMEGNMMQWCWDWAGLYTAGESNNPTGPATSPDPYGWGRSCRGGDYSATAEECRVSHRSYSYPSGEAGFRCVRRQTTSP